jgi:hypothetical protein
MASVHESVGVISLQPKEHTAAAFFTSTFKAFRHSVADLLQGYLSPQA